MNVRHDILVKYAGLMTRELMIRLGDEGDSKNENLIKIDTPVNPNSQNSPEGLAPPNLSIHKNDLARSTFVPKLKSVVEDNNSKAWPIGTWLISFPCRPSFTERVDLQYQPLDDQNTMQDRPLVIATSDKSPPKLLWGSTKEKIPVVVWSTQ